MSYSVRYAYHSALAGKGGIQSERLFGRFSRHNEVCSTGQDSDGDAAWLQNFAIRLDSLGRLANTGFISLTVIDLICYACAIDQLSIVLPTITGMPGTILSTEAGSELAPITHLRQVRSKT